MTTDAQIIEAIAQGKLTKHIMRELHVGSKRINELRGDAPRPALGRPKRAPVVVVGDEAEPIDLLPEPEAVAAGDTVTVSADYLHALEAVAILTHLLHAARAA